MNRYSLKGNTRKWGDMVVWLRENFGDAQGWGGLVSEPVHLKKPYKWAIGAHRINHTDPGGLTWPCVWIPDGPVYTAFLLRWS